MQFFYKENFIFDGFCILERQITKGDIYNSLNQIVFLML